MRWQRFSWGTLKTRFRVKREIVCGFCVTLIQFRQLPVDTRFFRAKFMPDHSRKLFEVLVRQNEASLIAYLRTMVRDPGLADDLFQETLITAWRRFDQYDQSVPLAPWLRGIALNLARNAGRRRQRECLIFSGPLNEAVEKTLQSVQVDNEEESREKSSALSDCLSQLPKRSRELIRQRYEQNLTASTIAELTHANSAGIRKQLQRIRQALADCVSRKAAGTTTS